MTNNNETTPDPDNDHSLNSSPPRLVNHRVMPLSGIVHRIHSMPPERLAQIDRSEYFEYSMDRKTEVEGVWKMIVPVLPKDIPCYLPNIDAAMLRRFKTIPIENWEKSVKAILVTESQRSNSPIKQHTENSFIVDVHLESWLSTHKLYSPDFQKVVQLEFEMLKEAPVTYSNRASSSTEDAHSLENRGVILGGPLAGFNPLKQFIPPGMNPEKVEAITTDILAMNDSKKGGKAIENILCLPKPDSLRYARGLWRMAVYDDVLLKIVFETFCGLAIKSSTWAEIVLDTIFCVELQPQDEEAPFNNIVDAGIALPPNMSVLRVAGFLYLLNYMNQSPNNWDNVIKWLTKKHTNRFKSLFVGTLETLGRYNEHLQGAVRRIIQKLLRFKPWEDIFAITSAYSVD